MRKLFILSAFSCVFSLSHAMFEEHDGEFYHGELTKSIFEKETFKSKAKKLLENSATITIAKINASLLKALNRSEDEAFIRFLLDKDISKEVRDALEEKLRQ